MEEFLLHYALRHQEVEEEKVDTKGILKASKQPEAKKTVKFLDEAAEVVNEAKIKKEEAIVAPEFPEPPPKGVWLEYHFEKSHIQEDEVSGVYNHESDAHDLKHLA